MNQHPQIIVQRMNSWPFDHKVIRTSRSGVPVAWFYSNREEDVMQKARSWADIYKLPIDFRI